jgi:hypothetical protein
VVRIAKLAPLPEKSRLQKIFRKEKSWLAALFPDDRDAVGGGISGAVSGDKTGPKKTEMKAKK